MRDAKCRYCGQEGVWHWDYYDKKPLLLVPGVGRHRCEKDDDIFPGWCAKCSGTNLFLIRKKEHFQLVESYGLPHTCTEDGETEIEEITPARCKYCESEGLLWVRMGGRFSLLTTAGSKHKCEQYDSYQKAWAEAKRTNYALEKAWVNSHADNLVCKKCKGRGRITFESRNKRLMRKYGSSEPITVYKPCRLCKTVGSFSPHHKKEYLRNLRIKYWPYRPGIHKWKPKKSYDF